VSTRDGKRVVRIIDVARLHLACQQARHHQFRHRTNSHSSRLSVYDDDTVNLPWIEIVEKATASNIAAHFIIFYYAKIGR